MCGIIGFTSKKNDALEVTLDSLKNLEYRGYDSSGIATVEDGTIRLYKSVGKISNLEKKLRKKSISTATALAHTRWATHGEPTETNAHPHKVGKICLVHNGIIENYMDLRYKLLNEEYYFMSDTDTEVATSYIDYCYFKSSSALEAINNACKEFEGSYAFGIIVSDSLDTIYATRKNSPLIIGLSDSGNFIASDISAILKYTNKYILLDELEIAVVKKDSVVIYDTNLHEVQKEVQTATWDAQKYQKNGYDHFMLKEIHEQPQVISTLFEGFKFWNKSEIDFKKYSEIHIVACGSAMHAGMVGKYLFENMAHIKTHVEIASEYRYKENFITDSTLVIIISQSGETADTLAALRLANSNNAFTLAIVNVVGSSIAREAKKVIYTCAGPEIAVATTKGYTSQIAILDMLVLNAMSQKQLISQDEFNKTCHEFESFESQANNVIENEIYKKIAKKLYDKQFCFFIGRGIDYASSMEGSLKLKEISYIHSEAYAAGELKHGTIALIEPGTIVFTIATENRLKTISNLKETKARGAYTILISPEDDANYKLVDSVDEFINIPRSNKFLTPLYVAFVMQLIAYETAKLKNTDIDKPKNLAKSVTVE